jgi:hypothetical protein
MGGRMQGWRRWRRSTACLLVAALLMQGLGFAFASAALAAGRVDSTDWAGFELCRHDRTNPDQPGAPDQPAVDAHCAFCVAGPGFVLEPPALSVLFLPVEIEIAPWPMTVWRLAPVTVDASSRPRGPPAVS